MHRAVLVVGGHHGCDAPFIMYGIGIPMNIAKPLLWLLEPYIVYKAYLWGSQFVLQPLTWEGDVDLFSLTLTVLLSLDAVVLPLVILYCPSLNPGESLPRWSRWMGTPMIVMHNWLDQRIGGSFMASQWLRKSLHLVALFLYYLMFFYIGGHLIMGLVVALMYDVLLWSQGLAV